ncbi:MAG: hypothetical protein NC393_10255 [Clostridium sp.]|nr:hypothetical protein [Clostridium sp.]MCM1207484.1 hypothetical protein [Ruminococcus sp.]
MIKEEIYQRSREIEKRSEVIDFLVNQKGFTSGAAHVIVTGFEAGVNVDIFADKDWDYDKIKVVMQGLLDDVNLLEVFPEYTSAEALRLALDLIKDGKEIPNDLTADRTRSEIAVMRDCIYKEIPYNWFLENSTLIPHEELINSLLLLDKTRDIGLEFSWVTDEMSTEFVRLIWEAKSNGIFDECFMKYECAELGDAMTNAYINQINKLYSSENISKFKLFQGLNEIKN